MLQGWQVQSSGAPEAENVCSLGVVVLTLFNTATLGCAMDVGLAPRIRNGPVGAEGGLSAQVAPGLLRPVPWPLHIARAALRF